MFADESGDDFGHLPDDVAGFGRNTDVSVFFFGEAFSGFFSAEDSPETFEKVWPFNEEEEREDEGDGGLADNPADGRDARDDATAKPGEKATRELLDGA